MPLGPFRAKENKRERKEKNTIRLELKRLRLHQRFVSVLSSLLTTRQTDAPPFFSSLFLSPSQLHGNSATAFCKAYLITKLKVRMGAQPYWL